MRPLTAHQRLLSLPLLLSCHCAGYSVLTHEAVIDSVWRSKVRPMLQQRYPRATEDELRKARAYVYGGCLIQDLGYAPFASRPYSDLTHYVRSGDFVTTLLSESSTLNEYAFALGSLAHYASDSTGHPAINRIEPRAYPKLKARFGPVVTYEDSPGDHLKTEFALDVIQVSRGLYASDDFHDFIAFEVSQDLLNRAFQKTYGIDLTELLRSEDVAIGTYRFAAGTLIPKATRVAWASKRKDIERLNPTITRSQFTYELPARQFRKEWPKKYRSPSFGARLASFMFRLIPTFGPFKAFAFRPIPPDGEQMFLKSFDASVERYGVLLNGSRSAAFRLPNMNLDTGNPTQPKEYKLADRAYLFLLDKLAAKKFATVTPELRNDALEYIGAMDQSSLSAKTTTEFEGLRRVSIARR